MDGRGEVPKGWLGMRSTWRLEGGGYLGLGGLSLLVFCM